MGKSGAVYAILFAALTAWSLSWLRESVEHLAERERAFAARRISRIPRDPVLWLCALQFAFIAGSEGGATAILGSFVSRWRPSPFPWIAAERWPAAWRTLTRPFARGLAGVAPER